MQTPIKEMHIDSCATTSQSCHSSILLVCLMRSGGLCSVQLQASAQYCTARGSV